MTPLERMKADAAESRLRAYRRDGKAHFGMGSSKVPEPVRKAAQARRKQVKRLHAQGLTCGEIAEKLGAGKSTIRTDLSDLRMQKDGKS